jgi:methyl-accepting chemotaxis protein
MPSVPYINKPILTARDAIASHVRWKITLLMATRMREPLSARATHSIQHPDECSIRQWLRSPHTLHLRRTPEYRAVVDRHAEFHREMQTIASLINTGDFTTAERLLNAPTGFQRASTAVANAIMALDRIPAAPSAP